MNIAEVIAKELGIQPWQVEAVNDLEPLRFPEEAESDEDTQEDFPDEIQEKSDAEIIDEITGQGSLFSDEEQE